MSTQFINHTASLYKVMRLTKKEKEIKEAKMAAGIEAIKKSLLKK